MESSSQLPTKANTRQNKTSVPSVESLVRTESSQYREKERGSEVLNQDNVAGTITCGLPAEHNSNTCPVSTPTMQIPSCMLTQNPQLRDVLTGATYTPPTTTDTLRELDLQSIQHNLNLRVDLCYDHDLFFQPVSGRKGDTKRLESERYWLSLAAEFRIHFHNNFQQCQDCHHTSNERGVEFKQRLPTMFANLKEIVEMLVPDTEHEEIANRLDVDFLMQQIRHGALDAVSLAEWLASLITSHCAPMRDETARDIVTTIRAGSEQADMQMIVAGIEMIFGLLETMKLDVANHQIRAFRYPLIEDTIAFQQDCFTKTIENGTFDISRSQRWYRQASTNHQRLCAPTKTCDDLSPFESLIHGLVHLCDPAIKRVPNTLQYDYHRFVRLQEDLQDLVQIELCLQVFDQRVFEVDQSISQSSIAAVHDELKSRMINLTEDEDGNGGAISDHLDAISFELTRAVFSLVSKQMPTAAATSSNSVIHDFEFERTNKLLYEYFQAEDDEELITQKFLSKMEDHAWRYAQQFLPLSPLQLSNQQRQWNQNRSKSSGSKELLIADWDDMARRLAHIGAIHWKIWAGLCYLKDDDIDTGKDLFSPVSVYGDERFYGDELSDFYSPTISSSSVFNSPLSPQQPFTNTEFQQGLAAMSQGSCQLEDNGINENGFTELKEDTATIAGLALDKEFDIDLGKSAPAQLRKGHRRRSSM